MLPLNSVTGSAVAKATGPPRIALTPAGRAPTASKNMSPPARSLGSCSSASTDCPAIAAVNAATTRLRLIRLRIAFLHFGKLVEERIVTLSFGAGNTSLITALAPERSRHGNIEDVALVDLGQALQHQ